MLKIWFGRAVGKCLLASFLAVLFSLSSHAQDSRLSDLESSLNDLIYQLSQSVVTIESRYSVPADYSQGTQDETIFNLFATGIIYDSTGYVITLASSVIDMAEVIVRFEDLAVEAEVRAIDYRKGLALLKTAVPLGRPADFSAYHGCAGKMVLALGNAYGLRAAPSVGFCAGVRPDGMVQFSAPITSGTVGGGLFDLSGNLLGIISGGIGESGQTGAGLAIAAPDVRQAAEYLRTRGDRSAGYVGLTTTEIEIVPPLEINYSGYLAQVESPRIRIERGAVVTEVVPASPAAKAGLRKGDLLFNVNGRGMPSVAELADMVRYAEPGTVLELSVIRHNQPYTIPVKVGRVELSPFRTRFNFIAGERTSGFASDSLMMEIRTLKQTVIYLESRLEQLR